ncbi:MAG: hypothetical protein HY903_06420 [Deltaproteobacteria bacterium]|nr:hypothetical protein [Deltaproteobacteria bacterium]
MKLWQAQYNMIWLILLVQLAAVLDVIPHDAYIHAVLGLGVVGLAFRNKLALAKTQAPARLKRISAATASITVMAAVTGILLAIPPLHFLDTLWRVLHVLTIVAITTQAGSVATAYDMWEEKEFSPPSP